MKKAQEMFSRADNGTNLEYLMTQHAHSLSLSLSRHPSPSSLAVAFREQFYNSRIVGLVLLRSRVEANCVERKKKKKIASPKIIKTGNFLFQFKLEQEIFACNFISIFHVVSFGIVIAEIAPYIIRRG